MASPPSFRIRSVVLDCPDARALASFYAALLGGKLEDVEPGWCEVRTGASGVTLAFQQVEGYQRPEWPSGSPQQVHLDLDVDDLEAACRRAASLGAVTLSPEVEEPGCVFVVHADPAGHPFCLCEQR
jgi:predicted enzyme related to lactoylglutathione lyase